VKKQEAEAAPSSQKDEVPALDNDRNKKLADNTGTLKKDMAKFTSGAKSMVCHAGLV
jgi:hypothetical protein